VQSVFAKRNRETFNRVKGGLKIIAPETAIGVLVGSIAALLLPVLILIGSQISQFISAFPTTKSGQLLDPWLKTIAAPDRLTLIAVVSVFAFGYLVHEALWLFARRFYAWAIYEGTVLAAVCTFTIWIRSFWWALDAFGAGIFLVCVIAWTRFTPEDDEDHLINSDRPINHLSEDKLDRKKLIVSLVNRLLQDAAPVIALIGAYGDGKTSMLNLLDEQLQTEKVPVVRFKSSLPGDDLMLISPLFNSIGKQLRRRSFVRKLRNVLKRFARTFSGLVPYVPSGLKDVFAEPSQEDELVELTDRLDKLPVRRLVVLLDDMDRMQGSELRMLLKIIRAADDYPKLSFVCAFNKKALVDTLIRHQVTDRISMQFSTTGQATVKGTLSGEQMADDTRAGYEYLEKFFPVQVPVPKLDESQLAKEFDLRFNQFATRYGLSQAQKDTAAFDKEFNPYWKPLFRPSLSNLRKMNAYFNALNSSFGLVKDEVNVIDFMFVELLRQIDPETYEQVFRNRSLFYSPQWDLQRWDERFGMLGAEKEEEHYPKYDQMFRHLQGEERDLTLSLLGRLFPKVAKYDKNPLSFAATKLSENEADKQKRIYHPYYFMIYFSLHVPEGW